MKISSVQKQQQLQQQILLSGTIVLMDIKMNCMCAIGAETRKLSKSFVCVFIVCCCTLKLPFIAYWKKDV